MPHTLLWINSKHSVLKEADGEKGSILLFHILQMSQSKEIFLEELFNTPELNMSDSFEIGMSEFSMPQFRKTKLLICVFIPNYYR